VPHSDAGVPAELPSWSSRTRHSAPWIGARPTGFPFRGQAEAAVAAGWETHQLR